MYRALSHLDEPQSLPILKQIYVQLRKTDAGSISDFYWTVRIMTGRKALAFRKRIRAEVGMDNL